MSTSEQFKGFSPIQHLQVTNFFRSGFSKENYESSEMLLIKAQRYISASTSWFWCYFNWWLVLAMRQCRLTLGKESKENNTRNLKNPYSFMLKICFLFKMEVMVFLCLTDIFHFLLFSLGLWHIMETTHHSSYFTFKTTTSRTSPVSNIPWGVWQKGTALLEAGIK